MASIDYRVRLLTDLLMDRGLAWLAAEIIDAIEFGRPSDEDRDDKVSLQRARLNADLAHDAPRKSRGSEQFEEPSDSEPVARERLSPQEQVANAVDLLVQRLTEMGAMLAVSQSNLNEIFGVDVRIQMEFNDTPHELRTFEAINLSSQLRTVREQLSHWLMGQPRPGE